MVEKDIKKQGAGTAGTTSGARPIPKREVEEAEQRERMDGLLRIYQSAVMAKHTDIEARIIRELSEMVKIVERDDWDGIHLHDAFPKVDIRMLSYGCSITSKCPFLRAVLHKITMYPKDYRDYKRRAGGMIVMEHKRKIGKRR